MIDLQANLYPTPLTYEGRRLEGKVIVVFGASSGIGEAAVLRFAREGAAVMAAARRSERLISLVDQVTESGGRSAWSACDVRDEEQVSGTVARVVERFGRIDGAFNNAGVSGMAQPVDQMTPEVFDDVMAVNLRGVALCMKHEIRAMQDQDAGGAIVNTSSIGALNASPFLPDYGASKAAVSHLTRSAAVAFGPIGIRVNALAPGPTSSEMLDPWIGDLESRKAWASSPLPFIALADDIARAALFLLSDEARWITGHVLPIDGGAAAT